MVLSDTYRPIDEQNTADDYEVLARMIEYAIGEADRNGEILCAVHLSQALSALKMTNVKQRHELAGGDLCERRMVS